MWEVKTTFEDGRGSPWVLAAFECQDLEELYKYKMTHWMSDSVCLILGKEMVLTFRAATTGRIVRWHYRQVRHETT